MPSKHHTIEAMGNLIVPEEHREDFVRVIKYGLHSARPSPSSDLYNLLATWIEEEEKKINQFEGRVPYDEEKP